MFKVVDLKTGQVHTVYWVTIDKVNGLAKGLIYSDKSMWEFVPLDKFVPEELVRKAMKDERKPEAPIQGIFSREEYDEDDYVNDRDDDDPIWY